MEHLSERDDHANTPLTDESARGLKISWVATRSDLNEVEADNVTKGYQWLRRIAPSADQILTSEFVRESHREFFGDVWKWAGTYRNVDLDIGIEWHFVSGAVEQLVGNYRYRVQAVDSGHHDELCVGFHHELVSIHPFLNGNGRHARSCADGLAAALGRPVFSWGYSKLGSPSTARHAYIAALQAADNGDIAPLLHFARTDDALL